MTGYVDPRVLLRKYGGGAKKSWGQNFLISSMVAEAIVHAAVEKPDDFVVEIGSGLGTLTALLAQSLPQGRLVAIERERDMVEVLNAELGVFPQVEVRAMNALLLDYAALAQEAGGPVAVVGNLPYQIASPLLFKILDARAHVSRAIVMLQKEMAERLMGSPGTKTYSALTVLIGAFAETRLVVRAKSGAFHPAPRVDSAVVRLDLGARVELADPGRYRRLVNAAFGQRRKTLRNAWSMLPGAVDVLRDQGLDPQRRGETLSIAEFAAVANAWDGGGVPAGSNISNASTDAVGHAEIDAPEDDDCA